MSYEKQAPTTGQLYQARARALESWWVQSKVEMTRPNKFKVAGRGLECDEGTLEDLCYSQLYHRNMGPAEAFRFDFRDMVATKRQERIAALYKTIELTPNYAVDDSVLKAWLIAVTGEVRAPDLLVMKHFLWQVKRKMAGLPCGYEMVPILFGPIQGTGKSQALLALVQPIAYAQLGLKLNEVVDSTLYPMFAQHYVIVLDELARSAGGAFKEVENFKRIITAKEVSSRRFYKQTIGTYQQNATFIGSTNFRIDEVIYDSSGMRRFYQLNAKKERIDWQSVNTLDYQSLWRYSVDEHQPSPFVPENPVFNEVAAAQEDLRDITSFEHWANTIDIQPGSVTVSIKDAYSNYVQFCEDSGHKNPITKIRLGKYLRDVKGIVTVKKPDATFLVNKDFREGAARGLDLIRQREPQGLLKGAGSSGTGVATNELISNINERKRENKEH